MQLYMTLEFYLPMPVCLIKSGMKGTFNSFFHSYNFLYTKDLHSTSRYYIKTKGMVSLKVIVIIDQPICYTRPNLVESEPNDDVFLNGSVQLNLPSPKVIKNLKVFLDSHTEISGEFRFLFFPLSSLD